MPRAIVLNPTDNVATLLDAGHAGEACALEGERSGKLDGRRGRISTQAQRACRIGLAVIKLLLFIC